MIEVIDLKMSNCYLIKSEDGNGDILVDTSTKENRSELVKRLGKVKLAAIVLTHAHVDHAGNAKYLSEKYKCPVLMNRADFDLLNNNLIRKIYSDGIFGKILVKISEKNMKETPISIPTNIQFISPEDTLSKFGFPNVKIIGLPGHTRGSIGVLEGKKDLIVGDTLMNWRKPAPSAIYEERAALLNSLEVIKDILPSKLYPGHGKVFKFYDYFKMEKLKNIKGDFRKTKKTKNKK